MKSIDFKSTNFLRCYFRHTDRFIFFIDYFDTIVDFMETHEKNITSTRTC